MRRLVLLLLGLLAIGAHATVTTTTLSVSYTCTGSVGPYSFTFPISDPTALTVTQNGTPLASSAWTSLPVNNNYENGGNVTLSSACPNAQVLVIERTTPVLQETIFTDNMPQPMSAFMYGLDKLTEIAQEQQSTLDNAVCQPGQVVQSVVPLVCVAINGGGGGGGNYVSTITPTLQPMTGPLASPYFQSAAPVPYSPFSGAALGYGFSNTDADIYTGTQSGAGTPAFQVVTPNFNNTAWQSIFTVLWEGNNSGNAVINGSYQTILQGGCYQLPAAGEGMCDDGATHGVTYNAAAGSTYGHRFQTGGTTTNQFGALGDLFNPNGIVIPYTATGYTGSGNVVLSNAPTLANPVVGTQTTGDNSTKAASTAFVQATVTAIGAGVSGINGTGGAWTCSGGGITCNTGTRVITVSTSGIANVLLTPFGSSTAVAANTCTTPATFTMTGVVVTPNQTNVWWGWQGNPYLTTGWGQVGGLVLNVWASSANTVSWSVCNQTTASITSGTPTFIISAQ